MEYGDHSFAARPGYFFTTRMNMQSVRPPKRRFPSVFCRFMARRRGILKPSRGGPRRKARRRKLGKQSPRRGEAHRGRLVHPAAFTTRDQALDPESRAPLLCICASLPDSRHKLIARVAATSYSAAQNTPKHAGCERPAGQGAQPSRMLLVFPSLLRRARSIRESRTVREKSISVVARAPKPEGLRTNSGARRRGLPKGLALSFPWGK